MGVLISIDNGGTFTDICLIDDERTIGTKTLTTPHDLTRCFMDVLKVGSKEIFGNENVKKLLENVDYIRYSTTAGTNALVQKKGPRLGLIINENSAVEELAKTAEEKELFNAVIQDRVKYLDINNDQLLEKNVIEAINELLSKGANRIVISLNVKGYITTEKNIRKIILQKYPRHLLGSVPILFSHELVEDRSDFRRTWSAIINSFLHPKMDQFLYSAENILREYHLKNPLLIFQNDGNSSRVAKTTAIKTYGSGPRGGMEGAKVIASHYQIPTLLTLDIGGTTSDIGVVVNDRILEDGFGKIEGVETSLRMSDLISVGAGGSSIIKAEEGNIVVGPESVGAAPGPACFGRGGQAATITDANLLRGIFDAESYFGGNLVLDKQRAEAAIQANISTPLGIDLEDALLKMEDAYNQKIADGLAIYQQQYPNPTLLAFGGAGPMNACGIAQKAGIKEVIVPSLAAVFSAFGISFSDIAHEYQVALSTISEELEDKKAELLQRAIRDMFSEGFEIGDCLLEYQFVLKTPTELSFIPIQSDLPAFENGSEILLQLKVTKPLKHFAFNQDQVQVKETIMANPLRYQNILNIDKQWESVPVYAFKDLQRGDKGAGPLLIEDDLFTCNVLKGWIFTVNANRDIVLTFEEV